MIAAVNGVAVGGGLEMALACDIIVAADHARFGLPEPRVGLFAGAGRHPPARAAGAVQAGDGAPADRPAHRGGRGVPDRSRQRGRAARRADADGASGGPREILECSPLSVRLTKEAVFDGLQYTVDEALERDADRRERLLASADYVEGPKAFAEKRKPAVDRPVAEPRAARAQGASGRSSRRRSVAIVGASDRSGWSSGAFANFENLGFDGAAAPREPKRRHRARAAGGHELPRDRRAGRPRALLVGAGARCRTRSQTSRRRVSATRSCSPPASARPATDGVERAAASSSTLCRELDDHVCRPELPRLRQRRRPRAGVVGDHAAAARRRASVAIVSQSGATGQRDRDVRGGAEHRRSAT